MAFSFEKLDVYQKAVTFADRVCQATEGFSRGYGFLSDQLNRAALSIAANIAEGNGRFTKPDRKYFFGIARGSVQECVPLLELALRAQRWCFARTRISGQSSPPVHGDGYFGIDRSSAPIQWEQQDACLDRWPSIDN